MWKDWPERPEDDIQFNITSKLLGCRVSSEAFPLPGDPDVSLPAELVVACEEDPVVGEPDALLAGALRVGREAEEDVPDGGTAGEVRGHQALRVLSSPYSTCKHRTHSIDYSYFYQYPMSYPKKVSTV